MCVQEVKLYAFGWFAGSLGLLYSNLTAKELLAKSYSLPGSA